MKPMPGDKFLEALRLLHEACAEIGIAPPSVIGLRTNVAVNAVETALGFTEERDTVLQIIGGIRVRGIAIKARPE